MNEADEKIDSSGDIWKRDKQSLFVEDELLQFSAENEVSDPYISHCKGDKEISKKGFINSDCHRSRQGQENEFSITSRKYDPDAKDGRKQMENIYVRSDLKSISSERVCDSTKNADESFEPVRQNTRKNEMREEGEIDEDVQKQPDVKEGFKAIGNIHELDNLKSISLDRVCNSTKDADEGSEANSERNGSDEMIEEGEIVEDVQKQPKELSRTIRKYDTDTIGVISKKRRQPEAKDERGSKRRRDNETQNVKNSRSHLLHQTSKSGRKFILSFRTDDHAASKLGTKVSVNGANNRFSKVRYERTSRDANVRSKTPANHSRMKDQHIVDNKSHTSVNLSNERRFHSSPDSFQNEDHKECKNYRQISSAELRNHIKEEVERSPQRKRRLDTPYKKSPRPSHSYHDDGRYSSTYRRTKGNKKEFTQHSLSKERCHQSLDQNQISIERPLFLRAEKNSGRSSRCLPIRRCDQRRDPPDAIDSRFVQGRRENREESLLVQRRETISEERSRERGHGKYGSRDLNDKTSRAAGNATLDYASQCRNYGKDVGHNYQRNRERCPLESPSRSNSNKSSGYHRPEEDDGIPRFVSDNRSRALTDGDSYRIDKNNREELRRYGCQTLFERCDLSTRHTEGMEWGAEDVSQEKLKLEDENVTCPRNATSRTANVHSDKIWKKEALSERRVLNIHRSTDRSGMSPKTRNEIGDRQNGPKFKQRFLGTLKYLSRPGHTIDDIANTLAMRADEFDQYLLKEEKCPKLLPLIDILVKVAQCNVCTTSKLKVMYILRTRKFFERKDVFDSLKQIRTSPAKDSAEDRFLSGLLLVMKKMIDTVNLEEDDTTIARSLIESIIKHHNEDARLGKLTTFLKSISNSFESKLKEQRKDGEVEAEPFAETLPILPHIEIVRDLKGTDIPKHEIGQNFDSDRQYVSHMFVLFREDFIRPLCKGIRDYINHRERGSMAKFRSTDVRLFERVHLHSTNSNVDNGIVWKLQFEYNCRGNFYISILKYGSLLCLSPDDFNTMYYATVVNKDCLRPGNIDVRFLENNDMVAHADKTFVMLESRAFYEAYSHTLSLLKELAVGLLKGERTLPFEKYLLGKASDIEHPKYLEEGGEMSFTCLAKYGNRTITPIKNINAVKVQDSTTWPSSAELGLDISQHKALKLALTKEISLIQGPPGTGKTTMGIRIAELLLSNQHAWRGHKRDPMLLVSYTNHALDQFLQLLLNTPILANCLPDDVVRVGSRCEIEDLDKFSIKSHRKLQRSRIHTFGANYAQLKSIERNILDLKSSINCYKVCLVHERTFRELDFIPPWMYNQLVRRRYREKHRPKNESSLWIWLDLPSLFDRKEVSIQRIQSMESDYITEKDIMDEDFERVLDGEEDEWGIAPMPQDYLAGRPIVAIDKEILRDDPYYRKINQIQISALMGGIIQELSVKDRMAKEETERLRDIWQLSPADRWRLYRFWVFEATFPLCQQLHQHETEYDDASKRYREARSLLDCQIMKDARIVAMTTTAAARYTRTLQEIAPPVVIIEEAAQVSEQHVLGALSSTCQHLIMIGDHQQLRPAYNDYNLARIHHTDVSLFERLILNGMCYQQLENQHRMRPEIASLLVPHIYKSLENHESVFKYPDIKGVATNVYFIAHEQEEDKFDESLSHSNTYEAKFISKLYRHLRLQGYFQHEITVLSLYKDQVQLLRKKIRKLEQTDEFLMNIKSITKQSIDTAVFPCDLGYTTQTQNEPEVRIIAVDNFQGEENRIILLSLVRSNKGGKIGYLKAANRVCVALSRAREGLYVIGNMVCLRQASDLWEKVISKAETQGLCGKHLELKCHNHKENKMIVETPQDFGKYTDGGCSQPCEFRMDCGHTCRRKCHNDDPDHKIPCKKSCEKYCENGHCHEKLCHEPIVKCGERHEVILPRCGHTKMKKCFEDISEVKCDVMCHKELTCGHKCQRRCSEVCNNEEDCTELVKVTGKCGHECQIACSHQKHFLCKIPCKTVLECGHPCSGTCGGCHQGRLHRPCRKKCDRILICGHLCRADCTEDCPPCEKKCMNACEHSKCMKKCREPCIICREPCQWECRRRCPSGFKCRRMCNEDCSRSRCNVPCERVRYTCGHKCIALNCEECICRECEDGGHFEIFFGMEEEPHALFYKLEDCIHIFELSGLDKYMDMKNLERHVGLKVCPKCTTPILHSKRYGNVIKECIREIDAVKRKILSHDIRQEKDELLKAAAKVEVAVDRQCLQLCVFQTRNTNQVTAIHNQINFYLNVAKSIVDVSSKYKDVVLEEKRQDLLKELYGLRKWTLIRRFRFSEQELSEFKMELTRVRLSLRVEALICNIQKKKNIPQCDTEWTEKARKKLDSGEKLNEKTGEELEKDLKQLEEKYPHSGLGISEDERIMILKAMDFSQKGHWYKCKNGHIYAISECGGAMVEDRCPECSEIIGGSQHRLRDDNRVASEMDGAQFSAWSEQANMQNYGLMGNVEEML